MTKAILLLHHCSSERQQIAVSKFPNISGVNIGDYVQALASSQFLPHIDGFIDRDEDLKDYAGEPCKVIMNGWYMHLPQNWPPSDLIDPLFLAKGQGHAHVCYGSHICIADHFIDCYVIGGVD